MLRQLTILLAATAMIAGGIAASVSLAGNGSGGGPPTSPPGQGECEHGNSGQECKPDPQPEHGQDCDEHGNQGGVNEDHCLPTTTTTPTTPTIPTTPTTPTTPMTPTTPTETTPTTPEPPRCPPGQGPFAGKDGQPGNQECCSDSDSQQCDTPVTTSGTVAKPDPAPIAATVVPPQTSTPPVSQSAPVKPQAKPKPKPRATTVTHKAKQKPQPKLTGNPKTDKCKDLDNGTMRCKGVVVTQGNG